MKLIVGVALFVIGVLIVRRCIRDYRNNLGNALIKDLWDYVCGRSLSITVGILLTIVGAWTLVQAVAPGSSLQFTSGFPFVTLTPGICKGTKRLRLRSGSLSLVVRHLIHERIRRYI